MFGLPSPSKLIVLAVIVAAVWYGFKWIGKMQAQQAAERAKNPPGGGGGIDTVACTACGTYYDRAKGDLCGGDRCANTGPG